MSCARHLKLTHFRASIMIKSDPQWFPKQSGFSSLKTWIMAPCSSVGLPIWALRPSLSKLWTCVTLHSSQVVPPPLQTALGWPLLSVNSNFHPQPSAWSYTHT